ncbi:DUF2271 domain-containing protein [candidate division KSB1 bacterium]|nr:DUF2271 domain-containing protein [candidate division KSB1 bacterium]
MKKLMFLLLLTTCFIFCDKKGTEPEPVKLGSLKVSFELVQMTSPRPSYQTVIWLTDESGNFLKSSYVSEWLAYTGYKRGNVCPDWVSAANWEDVTESEFDAVTGATPTTSQNSIIIDCQKAGLKSGKVNCCIETHTVEDYNILFKALFSLGSKAETVTPEPIYIPSKHEETSDALRNVKFEYTPAQ